MQILLIDDLKFISITMKTKVTVQFAIYFIQGNMNLSSLSMTSHGIV